MEILKRTFNPFNPTVLYVGNQTKYSYSIRCDYEKPPLQHILMKRYVANKVLDPVFLDEAEILCEHIFATSLATITTKNEINDVLAAVDPNDEDWISTKGRHEMWIGLYNGPLTDNKWRWIDGKPCETDTCDLDSWANGQPFVSEEDYEWLNGAYYNESGKFVAKTENSYPPFWFLCNAPDSNYTFHTCDSKANCWHNIQCCNDSNLIDDFQFKLRDDFMYTLKPYQYSFLSLLDPENNTFAPPIAAWDSKLFIFGLHKVHYTDFKLFNAEYSWNSVSYSNWTTYNILQSIQKYAQYQYLVYFYDSDLNKLITFNLNNMHFEITAVSEIKIGEINCMVAGEKQVYVVDEQKIAIYQITTNWWNVSADYIAKGYLMTHPTACSITNDHKFIYVFSRTFRYGGSGNPHIKYNTETNTFEYLSIVNSCRAGYGKTITAPNNKMYFHGCYIQPFKTLIFDPETNLFIEETNGINSFTDPILFRKSQISVFDDNILVLLLPTQSKSFSMYYMITDLISINLTDTTSENVWPSDGFDIKYYLNDFSNIKNNVYFIALYSADATNEINETITLDISNDNCLCNNTIYNCYNCHQNFDLGSHLTVMDNDVDGMVFVISGQTTNGFDPLIIGKHVTISFQRCEIAFNRINDRSYEDNPMVSFNFFLSDNCYSRIGMNFSVNIISSIANIEKQLVISINNKINGCSLCEMNNYNDILECDACNNDFFEIKHEQIDAEKIFNVSIQSNTIDLKVISQNSFNFSFDKKDRFKLLPWHIALIASAVIFFFFSIAAILYYYRKNKILKELQAKFTHYIRNPMIITIGIAFYDDEVENAGIDANCRNLDGIDVDYANMKTLSKLLNCNIYPNYEKYDWTQNDMISFLKKCAQTAVDNIDTLNENQQNANKQVNGFDSILLVISGHGLKNNVITADYQAINKTAIHRLFSINYPSLREIPRIVLFDCCDGEQERSSRKAGDDSDTDDESDINMDKGKNFDVDNIEIKQYDDEVWKLDQKNPDFFLSLIHGANEGFQSKICSITGSYLIHKFVTKMILNVEEKKNIFFGEIIDEIQDDLHNAGKQQIKVVHNNHTRFLKFVPNYIESEQEENEKKTDNTSNNVLQMSQIGTTNKLEENVDEGNDYANKTNYSLVENNNEDDDSNQDVDGRIVENTTLLELNFEKSDGNM
eukprot:531352_1